MKHAKLTLLAFVTAAMTAFMSPGFAHAESDDIISIELKDRPLQQVAVTTKDLERAKAFYGPAAHGLH